uniref:Multidrug resistance-associated protein 1 n=1 Tax=Macrostomum lignano TaxID=282301 RepID=A0A1I8HPH1_9PLAT
IVCLVVQSVEQKRLIGASAMMFFFYMMSLVVSVPVLYTRIIMSSDAGSVLDVYGLTTFSSYLALLLTQLVLTCIYDSGLTPADEADDSPTATGSAGAAGAAGAVPAAERQPVFAECRSSIISRLTFSWLDRSVLNAYRKEIGEADVNRLDPSLRVRTVHGEFVRYFPPLDVIGEKQENSDFTYQINSDTEHLFESNEVRSNPWFNVSGYRVHHRRKLLSALWKTLGSQLVLSCFLKIFQGILSFLNPFILELLISFSSSNEELWHGILYVVLFFIVSCLKSICLHASFQMSLICDSKSRSALSSSIFRKSLSLSHECRAKRSIGEIVNLVTVDTGKIAESFYLLPIMFSAPIQLFIALALLWAQLGAAVLVGLGIFILIVFIEIFIVRKSQMLELKEMQIKDARLKAINEVISAMKVIKLYAWEPSFLQKITKIRRTEVKYLGQVSYLFSAVLILWTVAPFFVMAATFVTFTYYGDDHVLTASKAFVSLTLFNIIRTPISMLPTAVSMAVNAYVSVKRIEEFLSEKEIDEMTVSKLPFTENENPIEIQHASFTWNRDDPSLLLKHVNISVQHSKLVALVGKVGCGKSSLLQSILGETHKVSGVVTVRGSVAYVPQEAWIQNLTVRDNILFGRDFDQARYDEAALRACQLEKDLQLLTAGDATEIGERGINLSGGQKQRVSLARAVYQDSDIYLLDDPLAAVDSHVGKKLFHEVSIMIQSLYCLQSKMDTIARSCLLLVFLRDKTRILVTHGIHWLPHVDEIVVIDNGRISEQGSYEHLLDHDGPFASFLKEFFLHDGERKRASRSRDVSVSIAEIARGSPRGRRRRRRVGGGESENLAETRELHKLCSRSMCRESGCGCNVSKSISTTSAQETAGRVIEDEVVESGQVSAKSYLFYVVSRGMPLVVFILCAHLIYTAVIVASSIWLATWTSDPLFSNASVTSNSNNSAYLRELSGYYTGTYSIFGVAILTIVTAYSLTDTFSALRASRRIHDSLLNRLFSCSDEILRYNSDWENQVIDRELPRVISDFLECFMTTISCFVVISLTTPIFISAAVPLAIVYAGIQVFYLPVSRQSRRLESSSSLRF